MDIGILGGTFDPIHNGHLAIAKEARKQLGLATILVVPSGQPWLKTGQLITTAQHRVTMVELAIAGKAYLQLSTVEIDRPGPSYTIDTLRQLQAQESRETDFFFLMGWNSFEEVPRWKDPEELVRICRLVAFPRPGIAEPDLDKLDKLVPGMKESAILLDMPPVDISSTDIRNRVASGLSIKGLVPTAVSRYIRDKRLYAG